ncbi:type II secretion system protein [Lactiplantibacillus daowaiensis]|uniref:Prepilin-type N-terminal cleavage/methylation domain-containing protein n=1 Tax=Lactiplantibacillus daowaiensis TaxID=2559918 RepID=A0ABW1S0R0_9LACO|nr:type II secretion system protein [Lactiplantibacillus daowaiensis]
MAQNVRKGFTLLESSVVLVLLGSMLLISMYQFPSRQQQITNEKMFWEQFNVLWHQSIYQASSKHEAWWVMFDQATGNQPAKVSFIRAKPWHKSEDIRITLPVPKTIDYKRTTATRGRIAISPTGHPRPSKTIFVSTLKKETITITTLMGWGAYHTTVTKK